jgi:tetratricopeptide (TPR) repeat protein
MSQSTKLLVSLVSFLVFTFAFLMAVEKVHNYDIWWHLKTGQWIMENGRIPHADPFTFTTPDAPWAPHSWLSDVVFATTFRISGLDGLIIFKALIVGAAFFIVFRLMIRQGVNLLLAVAIVMLAVFISQFRFLLRPHVFMFLLSVAFFWMLSVWGGQRNLKLLWLLPLMFLWVNLHGSFFLGLVLVGCFLAEKMMVSAYERIRKIDDATSWPVFLALLIALLFGCILLNPFGLDLLRWVVTVITRINVTRIIEVEEHVALSWGDHNLFWSLMLATALSFPLAFRRARLFHFLLFAATSFLAIQGVRFVALAALLQAPILGYNLHVVLNKVLVKKYRPTRRLQAALAIPLLLFGGALLFQHSFAEDKVNRFGLGVSDSRFPGAAVDFLRQLNAAGNIYNSFPIGGYLLWELPGRKIFLDGRFLDAQRELITQLNTMTATELEELFNRFDIRAAILTRKDRRLAAYFSQAKDFRLAYFDDQALLYLGNDALPSEKMEGLTFLALVRPESLDFSYLIEYARSPMAPRVENELRFAVTQAPHSFQAHFLLAFFLEVSGRGGEALEQYLLAVRANPRLAFVHYDLGRRGGKLAVQLKKWDQATALLKDALRFKDDAELLFLLATSLYQSGHYDEAEKAYLEVLSRNPQQVASLVNLGYLYLDSERFQKAEEIHRQALKASSNNEAALFGLALALQREGKTVEASRRWQEFLKKHPQSPWREKARMHLEQLN